MSLSFTSKYQKVIMNIDNDFKKGEFNLIQLTKLTMIAVGGSIIAGSLVRITFQLGVIIKLLIQYGIQ